MTLAEVAGEHSDGGASHFGPATRLFWSFIYTLFVGGNAFVEHPNAFEAKSVLAVDVYEKPIAWGGTAYISVWASAHGAQGEPVLVPFPRVPNLLMKKDPAASFGDSARAYRSVVSETTARVNLVAPAALALAEQSQSR